MATPKKTKRPSSPSKPSARAKAARTSTTGPFDAADPATCYAHFLPLAEAEDAANLPWTNPYDVDIAKANVKSALAAIAKRHAEIEKKVHLPLNDLLELPAIVRGLSYAIGRVPAKTASTGEIDERIANISLPRKIGLQQLEVFADLGRIPRGRYEAIKKGTGKLDMANDAVAIAGAFAEYASIPHPIPPAMLAALKDDGAWLQQQLKTAGTKNEAPGPSAEQTIRDQFWKLVEDRYEQLRIAGAALFGMRHVDDHVPPLHSRTHHAATTGGTAGAPPPNPPAPPTATTKT